MPWSSRVCTVLTQYAIIHHIYGPLEKESHNYFNKCTGKHISKVGIRGNFLKPIKVTTKKDKASV